MTTKFLVYLGALIVIFASSCVYCLLNAHWLSAVVLFLGLMVTLVVFVVSLDDDKTEDTWDGYP